MFKGLLKINVKLAYLKTSLKGDTTLLVMGVDATVCPSVHELVDCTASAQGVGTFSGMQGREEGTCALTLSKNYQVIYCVSRK